MIVGKPNFRNTYMFLMILLGVPQFKDGVIIKKGWSSLPLTMSLVLKTLYFLYKEEAWIFYIWMLLIDGVIYLQQSIG